jgi:hypothetical protein
MDGYGHSDELVGKALQALRDKVVRDPEWRETALLDAFVLPPGVIAGEVNVVPMDRCHMIESTPAAENGENSVWLH